MIPILARRVGNDSPMTQLRRLQDGSVFDRFAERVDELWPRGRSVGDLEVRHAEA
ncbi:hypothetical protein [Kitasatospora sp. HPMI-4]|uniref:hypothetical protein n=1 Tax=Kitasatospora sp. HPMI-4 TaxID=3448443 RepID=UPI003F1C55DC